MKVYRSVDLFAGIGGIRLGFDKAFKKNIKTVFVSEWDKHKKLIKLILMINLISREILQK